MFMRWRTVKITPFLLSFVFLTGLVGQTNDDWQQNKDEEKRQEEKREEKKVIEEKLEDQRVEDMLQENERLKHKRDQEIWDRQHGR